MWKSLKTRKRAQERLDKKKSVRLVTPNEVTLNLVDYRDNEGNNPEPSQNADDGQIVKVVVPGTSRQVQVSSMQAPKDTKNTVIVPILIRKKSEEESKTPSTKNFTAKINGTVVVPILSQSRQSYNSEIIEETQSAIKPKKSRVKIKKSNGSTTSTGKKKKKKKKKGSRVKMRKSRASIASAGGKTLSYSGEIQTSDTYEPTENKSQMSVMSTRSRKAYKQSKSRTSLKSAGRGSSVYENSKKSISKVNLSKSQVSNQSNQIKTMLRDSRLRYPSTVSSPHRNDPYYVEAYHNVFEKLPNNEIPGSRLVVNSLNLNAERHNKRKDRRESQTFVCPECKREFEKLKSTTSKTVDSIQPSCSQNPSKNTNMNKQVEKSAGEQTVQCDACTSTTSRSHYSIVNYMKAFFRKPKIYQKPLESLHLCYNLSEKPNDKAQDADTTSTSNCFGKKTKLKQSPSTQKLGHKKRIRKLKSDYVLGKKCDRKKVNQRRKSSLKFLSVEPIYPDDGESAPCSVKLSFQNPQSLDPPISFGQDKKQVKSTCSLKRTKKLS